MHWSGKIYTYALVVSLNNARKCCIFYGSLRRAGSLPVDHYATIFNGLYSGVGLHQQKNDAIDITSFTLESKQGPFSKEKTRDALRAIRALCKERPSEKFPHMLELAELLEPSAYEEACLCLLQACIKFRALKEGRCVHLSIVKFSIRSNVLWNTVINMYIKCGSIKDAREAFDSMPSRNVYIWTTIISGYAQSGNAKEAFKLFAMMRHEDVRPDKVTYVSILSACAGISVLEKGKIMHAHMLKNGCDVDVFVGNALVDMYAKCGNIEVSRQLFDALIARDIVSWNAMITGYAHCGYETAVFEVFYQMQEKGVSPNNVTLLGILTACSSTGALELGKWVHAKILKSDYHLDAFLGNAVVDMYGKCRSFDNAWQAFNTLLTHDIVSWSAMISGNANHGKGREALKLFNGMQAQGIRPDKVTYVSILSACASIEDFSLGKNFHAHILKSGCQYDLLLGNTLLDMYVKCGSMEDARQVFNGIPTHDAISWNAMISGYGQDGNGAESFELFDQMQLEKVEADHITFVSILSASTVLKSIGLGKWVHARILKLGNVSDGFVGNTLVSMYTKFRSISESQDVFDRLLCRDIITWNALISGYAHDGNAKEALILFQQMQQESFEADEGTFVSVLNACADISAFEQGKKLHAKILKFGRLYITIGNALVDMYAKCGSLHDAYLLFTFLPAWDIVSWNVMIVGYAFHGNPIEALKAFNQIPDYLEPNEVTFVTVLGVCMTVELGKWIHSSIIITRQELDIFVSNALVDMYIKGGSIESARNLFDKIPPDNIMSWSTMITAYVQHGHDKEALSLIDLMQTKEGFEANQNTIVSILGMCASLANLELGKWMHVKILKSGCTLEVFVGSSIVDMYAKCGRLTNASQVFDRMPLRNIITWNTIITGYGQHGHGKNAIKIFGQMHFENTRPDKTTFLSALSACSHACLVEEGCHSFMLMSLEHEISPTMEHYGCLVDILGRAGLLIEAEDHLNTMPFVSSVWMTSLLGSCKIHGNVSMAERVVSEATTDAILAGGISEEMIFRNDCHGKTCIHSQL